MVVVAAPVVVVVAWVVEVAATDVTGTELVAAMELLGGGVVAGVAFELLHAESNAAATATLDVNRMLITTSLSC